MNIRNKQAKKRKKRPSPILRFTFIIILLVAAGFIIFYNIDNPNFVKNKFSSLLNDSESKLVVSDLPETDTGQLSSSVEEPVTGGDSGANEKEIEDDVEATTGDSSKDNQTESGLSLWQKIRNFFTNQKSEKENESIYPTQLEFNFYFSGHGEEKKLVSEKRTIFAGSAEEAVEKTVNELLEGPTQPHHFWLIPAGTELIGIDIYEKIVEIDLSGEFLENSLDTGILDEYVIYSIVNTLTEIPEVEGVIFLIDGVRTTIYGNVDLSAPAIRKEEYIDENEE